MRDRGTEKAKLARKRRDFCSKLKGTAKSKAYKNILNWEEDNVGTEDYQVKVTLAPGWSFESDEHDNARYFASTEQAMIAARNAHKCSCMFCIQPGK
jgi:hypothetical protein